MTGDGSNVIKLGKMRMHKKWINQGQETEKTRRYKEKEKKAQKTRRAGKSAEKKQESEKIRTDAAVYASVAIAYYDQRIFLVWLESYYAKEAP